MNKYISLILFAGLLAFSCGKKEGSNTTSQDVKPQQQNNNTTTNTQSTSAKSYYSVKNVGSSAGNKQLVDFEWNENSADKKLSDYKGKVILLNFWATWCPPCRKELPALSQIADEFKGKNFQMIGVSVDENPDALTTFLKSNSLSYTILHENGGLLDKYMAVMGGGQNVIPQTFIIDKNGKVVENIVGSRSKEDFVELINKYL
jgi:peroxiredoxin